jgi:hypothetical protein
VFEHCFNHLTDFVVFDGCLKHFAAAQLNVSALLSAQSARRGGSVHHRALWVETCAVLHKVRRRDGDET